MKILVKGKRRNFRSVWLEDSKVKLINQILLPYKFEVYETRTVEETADAIKKMVVRGAPAIGATAAYGMAQGVLLYDESSLTELKKIIEKNKKILAKTRPTAFDLFHALDYMDNRIKKAKNVPDAKKIAVNASKKYADDSAERCRKIGEHGEKLIKDGFRILTHCNAGAIACVDYGTALAPIRLAHYNGKKIHVWVDETRPRCQGAKLTAWELVQEGIPHSVIADNAAGYFMQKGEVDLVIVGADRIARNWDVANKIGTYEKAVLAKENGIPFYVAAPSSTIDLSLDSGGGIPIEERSGDEVHEVYGFDASGKIKKIRITPEKSNARNPAFDVTPAKYVTGIITEKGIINPSKGSGF